MAYQQIAGGGMWMTPPAGIVNLINNGSFGSMLIDATGEKACYLGRVWYPGRSSTKAVRRVGFRFNTVTKAGGSALTVSLQDPSTTVGPPCVPDETQDQTVAIANADASFVSNTWYRTGTLSADRTVSYGDDLAVVIEYDGGGRLSSDAVNFAIIGSGIVPALSPAMLKASGSWAIGASGLGNIVLEFSDGTFGTLDQCLPMTGFNTHSYNSGSTPDEYALPVNLPFKCKIDGLCAPVNPANSGSDFDLVLYQGTTALVNFSVDYNRYAATSLRWCEVPIAETELLANTQYYVAIKPTTTNSMSAYSIDVNDANQLVCWPGGINLTYTTRTDAGSWAAVTATRRLLAGFRISSIDDGAGGAAGMLYKTGGG